MKKKEQFLQNLIEILSKILNSNMFRHQIETVSSIETRFEFKRKKKNETIYFYFELKIQ